MLLETTSRILFLITTCFSLLIVVNSIIMVYEQTLTGLMGKLFAIPLSLAVVSFLFPDLLTYSMAAVMANIFLLAMFFGVLIFNPQTKDYSIVLILAVLLPVAGILLVNFWSAFSEYLAAKGPWLVMAAGLLLSVLLLVRKQLRSLFAYASIAITFMPMLEARYPVLAVVVNLAAYGAYFLYFLRKQRESLRGQYLEVRQKLNQLEKNINREIRKRTFEIERSNQNLLLISRLDALTKVYNRMTITNKIEMLCNSRKKEPFAIILFDIDHFKTINDTRGHTTGDLVLKMVTQTAQQCIREMDSIGRYGGDEFIILLPKTSLTEAMMVAERFRKKVQELEPFNISISAGLATYPYDGEKLRDLLSVADEGLYLSKKRGRNTVSHIKLR